MMILFGIVTILALASAEGAIFKNSNETDGYHEVSVNDVVDQVTPYLGEMIKKLKLDPARIPDTGFNFSVKGIFNTYKGRVYVEGGRMYDLSTIHRDGNFTIYYKDKHLRFETSIGFTELTVFSQYRIVLGFLKHSGMVTGKAKDVKATIVLDFYMNDYNLTLKDFDIDEKIQFRVKLYGNPLLDWIATPITNVILKGFSQDVIIAIENEVTNVVQNYLDIINGYFPRNDDILLHKYVYNYA